MLPPFTPPREAPIFAESEDDPLTSGHEQAAFGGTVESFVLVAVLKRTPTAPLTVTVVGPRGCPLGTCTVNCVGVADNTAARFGPKRTALFAAIGSKPLPLTFTMSPAWPSGGVIPVT